MRSCSSPHRDSRYRRNAVAAPTLWLPAWRNGLVADGHRVILLASGGSDTRAELQTVYGRPPAESLGDASVELARGLAGYGSRQGFDVVHDRTVTRAAVAALSDAPPVVHTVPGHGHMVLTKSLDDVRFPRRRNRDDLHVGQRLPSVGCAALGP